jgi:hypothetical protein
MTFILPIFGPPTIQTRHFISPFIMMIFLNHTRFKARLLSLTLLFSFKKFTVVTVLAGGWLIPPSSLKNYGMSTV